MNNILDRIVVFVPSSLEEFGTLRSLCVYLSDYLEVIKRVMTLGDF